MFKAIFLTSFCLPRCSAKNSGCYALWFRAMDWIFGTDKAFLAHKKRIQAGEADEVVPDEVK